MGKERRRFTGECKTEAVRLALSGSKSPKDVAKDLSLNPETLYRQVYEFHKDPSQSFPWNGQLKDRGREIEQLRRESTPLR